jgi:hypothetical protein
MTTKNKLSVEGFDCNVCGERHDVLPWSYSVKAPSAVASIAEQDLDRRVVFTPDLCVIDHRHFFLRGSIPVPVYEHEEPFIWGVWARVSEQDFLRANEVWKVEGRESEPAFTGWLQTEIPLHPNTTDLELRIRTQCVGRRPHFEIVNARHPLALEQMGGISIGRIQRIAEEMRHRYNSGLK